MIKSILSLPGRSEQSCMWPWIENKADNNCPTHQLWHREDNCRPIWTERERKFYFTKPFNLQSYIFFNIKFDYNSLFKRFAYERINKHTNAYLYVYILFYFLTFHIYFSHFHYFLATLKELLIKFTLSLFLLVEAAIPVKLCL